MSGDYGCAAVTGVAAVAGEELEVVAHDVAVGGRVAEAGVCRDVANVNRRVDAVAAAGAGLDAGDQQTVVRAVHVRVEVGLRGGDGAAVGAAAGSERFDRAGLPRAVALLLVDAVVVEDVCLDVAPLV